MRSCSRRRVSIVYISHRLEEIFELSQHISILKDGTYVGTVNTAECDRSRLVSMMVGWDIVDLFPARHAKIGDVVLKVENLKAGKMVKNVSFEVRSGEVLGFNGLVGSGRTETMRAIFGADRRDGGKVTYFGKEVHWNNPGEAIKDRFGLLPEDRKKQGLLLEQSIRVNATLASLSRVTRAGFINHRKEKKLVQELLGEIQTKYGDTEDPANSLSGGIDLAVGSVMALGASLSAYLIANMGLHFIPAMFVALLAGILAGTVTGVLVAYFRFQGFVSSLALMTIARGMALGGVFIAARASTGSGTVGEGQELDAIASCVIGGASLAGFASEPAF